MEIDSEAFIEWVQKRFSDIKEVGDEFMLHSIFTDDRGYHLSCNPMKNAFHCWKSSESGNLVRFISIVDKISYAEAAEILNVNDIRTLENKLKEYFNKKAPKKEIKFRKNINLPEGTIKINDLDKESAKYEKIKSYLDSRKIPIDDLYFCSVGKYANRIIIPYLSPDNDFFYWNGRLLDGDGLRYRGPEKKEFGIGKGDVLFTKKWADKNKRVYLTEGEFDAITLHLCGLNSFACGGKEVTDEHIKYLKDYQVCLAFDRDEAGLSAIEKIGVALEKKGFKDLEFVRPPLGYKDWNKVVETESFEELRKYIESFKQKLNKVTLIKLRLVN